MPEVHFRLYRHMVPRHMKANRSALDLIVNFAMGKSN